GPGLSVPLATIVDRGPRAREEVAVTANEHQEGLNLGLPAGPVTDLAGAGHRDGLSWTWDLDIEALLTAVTGPAPWSSSPLKTPARPTADAPQTIPADQAIPADADPVLDPADADLAEYLDAVEAGRSQVVPLPVVAGRVAELVPAGPGLAGWLGAGEAGGLEDGALAGMAASYRRLASGGAAGEPAVPAAV